MTDNTVLTTEECWELLDRQELCRIAFRAEERVSILPINYGTIDRTLVFSTIRGSKLEAVLLGEELVFEVDEIRDEIGMSVVVRGHGRVATSQERLELEQSRLRPWLDAHNAAIVIVEPEEITGRRYRLHRPWRSIRR